MTIRIPRLTRQASLLLAGSMACTSVLHAQEVGEYGFLQLPASPRAAALGGTCISVVEPEVSLTDQNPALLCTEMAGHAALSYMNYVGGINVGYAGYAGQFLSRGAWMGSVKYVNYGHFDGYDEYGTPTGAFSAQDVSFNLGIGHAINDYWSVGGAVRAIYTHYESYSAFALGVDVGLNYYNEVSGRSISMTLTNLGGQLKRLEDRHSNLPTQLNIGWTKDLEHLPFNMTLTAYDLLDWDQEYLDDGGEKHTFSGGEQLLNHLLLGAEWLPSDNFWLAASYNYRRQRLFSGMGGWLRGISLGAGLTYHQLNIQCSYARYNAADGSLSVGIEYTF